MATQQNKTLLRFKVSMNLNIPFNLSQLDEKSRDDETIVSAAIAFSSHQLSSASMRIRNSKPFMLPIAQSGQNVSQYLGKELKKDIEVASACVNHFPSSLKHFSKEIRDNFDVVKIAVSKYGGAIKYASRNLKSDKEIVLIAIRQNKFANIEPPDFNVEMLADTEIALEFVKQNADCLLSLSKEQKNDPCIVLVAVSEHIQSAIYASDELKKIMGCNSNISYRDYDPATALSNFIERKALKDKLTSALTARDELELSVETSKNVAKKLKSASKHKI